MVDWSTNYPPNEAEMTDLGQAAFLCLRRETHFERRPGAGVRLFTPPDRPGAPASVK